MSDPKTIAEEIAANPDEMRRMALSGLAADVGNVRWGVRGGRVRHWLWKLIYEKAVYRAWVHGFEAGRESARRRGDFDDWRACHHRSRCHA